MMTNEEEVIQKAQKAYIKYFEDLDNDILKDEFVSLKAAYEKLNKQMNRIIKRSDSSLLQSKVKEDKTSQNLKKLKSHVITKVSQTKQSVSQEKEKILQDLATANKTIQELKENTIFLQSKNKSQEIALERYTVENRKLIDLIEKNKIEFKSIAEVELLKAAEYNYPICLIAIKLINLEEIQEKLVNTGKINNIMFSIERFFERSVKKIDIVRYMNDGLFYILYFDTKHDPVDEFIDKVTQPKKLENVQVNFKTGKAKNYKDIKVERFISDALTDLGVKKTFNN